MNKNKKQTEKARKAREAAMNPHGKKQAEDARAVLAERVLELRSQGKDFRAIGKALGFSHEHARELFEERLAKQRRTNTEAVKTLRRRMEHELGDVGDRLLELILSRNLKVVEEKTTADGGTETMELADFERITKAVPGYVKVQERLAKLLGLDAPEKVEVGGEGGIVTAADVLRRLKG